jgi:hypothetical protein
MSHLSWNLVWNVRIKFSLSRKLSGYELPAISKWHNVVGKPPKIMRKHILSTFSFYNTIFFCQVVVNGKQKSNDGKES